MTTGTGAMHRVMLAIGRLAHVRVFRNNVALAWVGNGKPVFCRGRPMTVTLQPGDAVLRGARPLHAGLVKGSADLIGWTSRTITPTDVGDTWAVFTAIEGKSGTGRADIDQKRFLAAVTQAGGIAGVARTPEDAVKMVSRE